MKKVVSIALLALLGFGGLSAQERTKGEVEITPFIGYQESFFNGDNVSELDYRGAIKFSANVDYFFNDRWSLRSGLIYDSMGGKGFGYEAILDYLNIPLNANWHFGSTRKWNLNFGITPGFLISAKEDKEDIKEYLASFQLGTSFGIGYKLTISENFSLLFDVQNLLGITNIIEKDTFDRLNAGYSFNIGGVFVLQ
jgi:hypothetical protein